MDAAHDAEVLAKLLGQQADETLRARKAAIVINDIQVIELCDLRQVSLKQGS